MKVVARDLSSTFSEVVREPGAHGSHVAVHGNWRKSVGASCCVLKHIDRLSQLGLVLSLIQSILANYKILLYVKYCNIDTRMYIVYQWLMQDLMSTPSQTTRQSSEFEVRRC